MTNIILCMLLALSLSACSDDKRLKDLQQEFAQQAALAVNSVKEQPLIAYKEPKPVLYNRGAYSHAGTPGASSVRKAILGNPLLAYPVKSLTLAGTLLQDNIMVAYILTPDQKLYSAHEGDAIGNNHGKIIKIDVDHIDVQEEYSEPGQKSIKQIETLKLKDESNHESL